MCIMIPNSELANTKIFVSRVSTTEQSIVYSMSVETQHGSTALILPIPVKRGIQDIRFVSLQDEPELFKKIEDIFPRLRGAKSLDGPLCFSEPLPIHEVGDYIASFVPSLKDWDRIDKKFHLPDNIIESLPYDFEKESWGFVVFQLNELAKNKNNDCHPMAFIFEFDQEYLRDNLFVPTVHYHGTGKFEEQAEFDHVVYYQGWKVSADNIGRDGWNEYEGESMEKATLPFKRHLELCIPDEKIKKV